MNRQRTKAEVLKEQRGVIGCCDAYANRQSCSCLETAVDDSPTQTPSVNDNTKQVKEFLSWVSAQVATWPAWKLAALGESAEAIRDTQSKQGMSSSIPVDDFAFLVGNYAYRPYYLPGATPACYTVWIRRIVSVGPGVLVVDRGSGVDFWELADCFNTYSAAADNARWQAERRGLVFRDPEGREDKS